MTVTFGNAKVGVGVSVRVGVSVMVGVSVNVGLGVNVEVEVTVLVADGVHNAAVADAAADVAVAACSGESPQADRSGIRTIRVKVILSFMCLFYRICDLCKNIQGILLVFRSL